MKILRYCWCYFYSYKDFFIVFPKCYLVAYFTKIALNGSHLNQLNVTKMSFLIWTAQVKFKIVWLTKLTTRKLMMIATVGKWMYSKLYKLRVQIAVRRKQNIFYFDLTVCLFGLYFYALWKWFSMLNILWNPFNIFSSKFLEEIVFQVSKSHEPSNNLS